MKKKKELSAEEKAAKDAATTHNRRVSCFERAIQEYKDELHG